MAHKAAMISARIPFRILISILMILILASCVEKTSTIKMPDDNTTHIRERPDAASVVAPAARDVDSKGGLTQQR